MLLSSATLSDMPSPQKSVEVSISQENGKAVIQGKTSIPFKMFVSLILQRRVQTLFKDHQNEPIIIGSDLLTTLASAPDDRQEDRGKLVTITLGVGALLGIFVSCAALMILMFLNIQPTITDLSIVLIVLLSVCLVGMIVQRAQGTTMKQKVYEQMERISDMLSK